MDSNDPSPMTVDSLDALLEDMGVVVVALVLFVRGADRDPVVVRDVGGGGV